MPYIKYVAEKKFRGDTLSLIQWADRTATDYRRRGFELTLRQLYYQGVTENRFRNDEKNYNRLKSVVSDGRLMGLIDWDHLTDRGRTTYNTAWFGHQMPSIESIVESSKYRRTLDMWEDQPRRIEVWVEKQALEQVAQRAADRFRVPYIACKGYMSQSEIWAAGHKRIRGYAEAGQSVLIIHLGDHDPSGIDMTRDVQERLSMFAKTDVEVRRIALNMDQIEEFNPPPNPAKQTDSRFADYAERYGDESWELDSIRPEQLVTLIQDEIRSEIDDDLWTAREEEEDEAIKEMGVIADRWPEIREFLEVNPA